MRRSAALQIVAFASWLRPSRPGDAQIVDLEAAAVRLFMRAPAITA